ncbi:hypothetical protein STANM309S_01725 [Streptomyces tanashiensis]
MLAAGAHLALQRPQGALDGLVRRHGEHGPLLVPAQQAHVEEGGDGRFHAGERQVQLRREVGGAGRRVGRVPGQEAESDPDCHNQDEVMIILSGTGSVTLDGAPEPPFRAGDIVVLPRNQEHVVHNTGDAELSWVSLYWPLREPAVRTENEEVAA